jgi:hypothetical protein
MVSSTNGGVEQRVWMHWKSLKMSRYSDGAGDSYDRGTYIVTPNWVWLRLARQHKMPVRQVKDIINKRREEIKHEEISRRYTSRRRRHGGWPFFV